MKRVARVGLQEAARIIAESVRARHYVAALPDMTAGPKQGGGRLLLTETYEAQA